MTLPSGLELQQTLEAAGGDLVVVHSVDEARGEAVAVEVPDELWFWQRASWRSGRGRAARFGLEHTPSVEPADPSDYGRAGGSAFRTRDEDAGREGVVVHDCGGDRCLRVSVTAPRGRFSAARAAQLAAGVSRTTD